MNPILLLIVLVAVLAFVSWYKRAPKSARTRGLIYAGIAIAVLGLISGRLNPVIAALAALVPIAHRALGALRLAQTLRGMGNSFRAAASGPSANQGSDVQSRFLRMHLDHDSGALSGEILSGPHAGSRLADVPLTTLMSLYRQWQIDDPPSAQLLESYLDSAHGEAWRDQEAGSAREERRVDTPNMSHEEACKVLGVDQSATKAQIVAAHRRLMQRLHPDHGGSTFLAAQINRAKQVLLAEQADA